MYYVYLLLSKLNRQIYIGSTNNLKRRLTEHNDGKEIFTKRYRPWILFYCEAYPNGKFARLREKRLKYSGNALRELKKRIGLPKSLKSLKNYKSGAGFTLVELLIVMLILGVLLIIVMINFQAGRNSNNLRQAGIELLQDFRLAQGYTIGGNSMNYCDGSSPSNPYSYCPDTNDGTDCGGAVDSGLCKNGVPLGGFGINLASTDVYTLFADTNDNQELDQPADRQIIVRNIFTKGLHVSSFKLGNQSPQVPASDNYINIMFYPPEAGIHYWVKLSGDSQATESQETDLSLLVSSDYVSNSCRKITINSISGQISESQSECSL